METKNTFEILNNINVNNRVKEKLGFKYLSWADAWAILKKNYPNATSTIYTRKVKTTETLVEGEGTDLQRTVVNESEVDVPYFTDGKTAFVKVGVTIEGVEQIEYYPVLDKKNNAKSVSLITMMDVNTALQRAFVKACGRHGLGLYLYAGEDLPEIDRKVIDYNDIAKQAYDYPLEPISEEDFRIKQQEVIKKLSNNSVYSADVITQIQNFGAEILDGKRISAFTYPEDSEKLQRFSAFLFALDKAIEAK